MLGVCPFQSNGILEAVYIDVAQPDIILGVLLSSQTNQLGGGGLSCISPDCFGQVGIASSHCACKLTLLSCMKCVQHHI